MAPDALFDFRHPTHENKARRDRPIATSQPEPLGYINGEPVFSA